MMGQKRKKKASPVREEYILTPDAPFSVREAYKAIRTNLMFSVPGEKCKKIMLTSSLQHEGKSITAINLGIVFAEAGKKVLLLDCDLRLPTVAQKLRVEPTPGLSNLLVGLCDAEAAIRHLDNGLDLMPAGDIPPNPSELLGSERMAQLLKALGEYYDYILLDTPPVCSVTDAVILSKTVSGVLLVARRDVSTQDSVDNTLRQLQLAGAKVLGFVFSGAHSERNRGYKKYQYDYGYAQKGGARG